MSIDYTGGMQTILVIEDDWELNKSICYMLEKDGFRTFSAHTAGETRRLFLENDFQMALLDVNLPDGDGFDLCRWMKIRKEVPVIFLTARDLEEDALKGYELGAEDYVTKPFSMKILRKKMDIILRRVRPFEKTVWQDGRLLIDFDNAKVTIHGQDCPVTPTEFKLLKELVSHKGQLLTYDVLLDRLWEQGSQFTDKHALAVNINRLRGKLEAGDRKYISNVYGMGYQWIG